MWRALEAQDLLIRPPSSSAGRRELRKGGAKHVHNLWPSRLRLEPAGALLLKISDGGLFWGCVRGDVYQSWFGALASFGGAPWSWGPIGITGQFWLWVSWSRDLGSGLCLFAY